VKYGIKNAPVLIENVYMKMSFWLIFKGRSFNNFSVETREFPKRNLRNNINIESMIAKFIYIVYLLMFM